MTKEELIDLVTKIMNVEGTEEEVDEMIRLLEKNVLDPDVSDYIFYDELSPIEVVEKCLKFKPQILGSYKPKKNE